MTKPVPAPPAQLESQQLRPPGIFRGARWLCFTATVGISIGMLAMLDKHLTSIPFTYDGPDERFTGRTVRLSYCLLSPTQGFSADVRCNFAFATASVSLALALVWSYTQALRRNPYRHPKARLVDLVLSLLLLTWWLASAIVLSVWTDSANRGGLPRDDWRNGMCALAWANFLFASGLGVTSAMLMSPKNQKMFDDMQAKAEARKHKKAAAHEAKQKAQADNERALASSAAAAAARASSPGAGSGASAAAARPAPGGAWSGAAAGPNAKPAAAGGDANPFRAAAEPQLPASTRGADAV